MAKPTGKLIRMTPELVGALPVAGTAEAAKKLAVAVTINGVTFDGSKAITLTAANIGALTDTQAAQKYALRSIKINGLPLSADVNLLASDVNAWNKTEADGRYLLKTATAVAATKLATARNINGVPFDGTGHITIPVEGVGNGQEWQNLTANRAVGVIYTNATGRAISVSLVGRGSSDSVSAKIYVGDVIVAELGGSSTPINRPVSFIVPTGKTYKVDSNSYVVIWSELR
ncbi:hypothetical protein WCT81_01980 [Pectobacterium versatile]|uniref:hypothetical protein n=1 Tax=Pectobacterium versatile TaxID=2488639 RepID=UPI003017A955